MILDTTRRLADLSPTDAGWNVTATVQLAPGGNVGVRLAHGVGPPGATRNIALLGPVTEIVVAGRNVVPVFEMVKNLVDDGVPMVTEPKF